MGRLYISSPAEIESKAMRVLAMISRAAKANEACPDNGAIAALVGASSISAAPKYLDRLEKKGLISVERFNTQRRVTIVATGDQTRIYGDPRPHWSLSRKASPARPRQAGQGEAGETDVRAEVELEKRRVDREPCPRCGVRRDVGCRHLMADGRFA